MTRNPAHEPAVSSPSRNAAFRWPTKSLWLQFARHVVVIQSIWLVVYGGSHWIAANHSYRVRLHFFAVELELPFFQSASVVYLSLMPLLWISPFVLHSSELLKSFAKTLAVLICVSGIGFLLLPSVPAYPTPNPTGRMGEVFKFMDSINLSHNMCPSLHVSLAAVAAYTYARVLARPYSIVVIGWATAIALSTLFTHQHHVVDVLAGAALGCLIARTYTVHSDKSRDSMNATSG